MKREMANFGSKLVPRRCSSFTCELEITHPVALDPHLFIATQNQYLKGVMRSVMVVSKVLKPRATDVYRAIIDTNTPLVLEPMDKRFLICCAYRNIYQLGNARLLYENRPKKIRICVVSTNYNVLKH